MSIPKPEADKMRRLAKEGKQISKIVSDDFPGYDYWEVYLEVYGSGERSARGVKRMISTRLDTLVGASAKSDRKLIVEELHDLVWHLYENHKSNQQKLEKIRAVLGE